MLLVIDNYDSFTYNLVQYFGELGAAARVVRNDELSVEAIIGLHPSRVVISPGPGRPEDAGVSMEVIRQLGPRVPLLGVCLGHQAIGAVFGGSVARAPVPRHGKTSLVTHDGQGVFAGLGPFDAARYHSLVVEDAGLPPALAVTARSQDDNLIMGLRHERFPIHGVQFHPESVLTAEGRHLLRNFLAL